VVDRSPVFCTPSFAAPPPVVPDLPAKSTEFGSFYRATSAALRQHLARIVHCRTEAEDLAQDAYARVYAAMRQRIIHQPKAFLFTTGRRLAFNQMRRRRISPLDDWELAQAEQVPDEAPGIERMAVAREEWARLEQAIAALPPGCRAVLLLCKLERLSHAQVGGRLGIAVSTVEKQHARALRLLNESMPLGGFRSDAAATPPPATKEGQA